MQQFYSRELTEDAEGRTTLRAIARHGEPRASHCIQVAGVLVNYMREELE